MPDRDLFFERVRDTLRPEFEVEKELGRGGMGLVYQALDTALGRLVAIKVLPPGASATAEKEFSREAQNLAGISSDHVVTVYQGPKDKQGIRYFVMELMSQGTLHEQLKQRTLSRGEVLELGSDLLSGLDAIHQAKLIHRDLKPANIFLRRGRGVIGDFGIARRDAVTHTDSTSDRGRGTPGWMAPEQLVSDTPRIQTDIYQAGLVLFAASTGRQWSLTDANDPRAFGDLPGRLQPVLQRALQLKEQDRWPTANDFRQALLATRGRIPPQAQKALVILTVVVLIAFLIRRSPPQQTYALAILPFKGMDSIAKPLTQSMQDPFYRFNRIAVRPSGETPSLPENPSSAEVRQLHATYYVQGDVTRDAIDLTVSDTLNGHLRIRIPQAGLDPLAWARAAADSVVHRFFLADYRDFHAVAGCGGSEDFRAIADYLDGQQAFQRDAYGLAGQRFAKALDHDANFVLAAWQLALAHRWGRTLTWTELLQLQERARSCGDSDSWFTRLLAVQLDTNLTSRMAGYREVIRQAPTLGVARLLYADDMFHRGALIGFPLDSAIVALEDAIAADSSQDQAPALDHLIWGHIRLGHEDLAEQAVERREAIAELHKSPEYEEGALRTTFLRLAYNLRFRPWWGLINLHWLAWRPDSKIAGAFREYVHLASAFDIPDGQYIMGQSLSRSETDPAKRGQGFEAQGLALVAMGRPAAAGAAFDSAAAMFHTPAARLEAAEWRILGPLLGLPEAPDKDLRISRETLNSLTSDRAVGPRAIWALALDGHARRDTGIVRRMTSELLADTSQVTSRAWLSQFLAAFDSAAAGHLAPAIAISTPLLVRSPERPPVDPFAPAILHLARAAWLEKSGQTEAARPVLLWYQNTEIEGWGIGEAQAGHVDAALSGVVRVRLARLAQAQGDTDASCHDLTRVNQIWEEAEPSFFPLRDSVRSDLATCR